MYVQGFTDCPVIMKDYPKQNEIEENSYLTIFQDEIYVVSSTKSCVKLKYE